MADVRLIDANALHKNVKKWLPQDPCGREEKEFPFKTDICVSMMMEIEEAPTIEAVPVVRCLKCRHARELTYAEGIRFTSDCLVCMNPHGAGVSYPEYNMDGRVVWKSDYCSYGDQKHDGGTEDD